MTLKTECWSVSEITPSQKWDMFRLMDAHYANVTWDSFLDDLANKQWVLALRSKSDQLVGFSTQKVFDYEFDGNRSRVVFSGDTVIDKAHRGSQALAWGFGRFMWELQQKNPNLPLYWLLTSKGVRTYRYLPLYFLEFFPRFDRPTPSSNARLMEQLGIHLFASRYERQRGVLTATHGDQRLREFEFPEHDSTNPHCRYFTHRNAGYRQGEELVCLAQFSRRNVNERVWRAIERHAPLITGTLTRVRDEGSYVSVF